MTKYLDYYSVRARLFPALIVLTPIFILIIFSFYENIGIIQIILAFITTFGFSFLLAQLARDRGKRKEIELFNKWGGKPTTIFLRYSEKYLDDITRKRYFEKLTKLIDKKLPTKDYENKNCDKADELYAASAQFLINNTRDNQKYHMLFSENISYGFRRNLWGLKVYAISILIICLAIQLAQNYYFVIDNLRNLYKPEILIPVSLYLFLLIIWLTVIKPNWIKQVAFEYAKRLYETLDLL